jgi:hypothetical protein
MTRCTARGPMCGRSRKKSLCGQVRNPIPRGRKFPLNIVDIETKSGNVLSTRVAYHLGHFKRFMTTKSRSVNFVRWRSHCYQKGTD